jgi:hypothetical protein
MRLMTFLFVMMIPAGYAISQQAPQLPMDPDTKLITYREVVDQEGIKDVLFDRGMGWLRIYYVNPNAVANVMDKPNGKIEGTGRIRLYYFDKDSNRLDAGLVLYALKMEFKDNKYRYTLNDFTLKAASRVPLEKWMNKKDPAYNPQWDSYLYQVDTTMQRLIRSMKEGMKPKVIKKDEW